MKIDDKELERLLACDQDDLDEEVAGQKDRERAEINNSGRRAQIAYLLGVNESDLPALVPEAF